MANNNKGGIRDGYVERCVESRLEVYDDVAHLKILKNREKLVTPR